MAATNEWAMIWGRLEPAFGAGDAGSVDAIEAPSLAMASER